MTLLTFYGALDSRRIKEGPGEEIPSCRLALYSHLTDEPLKYKKEVESEHARWRKSCPSIPPEVKWLQQINNWIDFQI